MRSVHPSPRTRLGVVAASLLVLLSASSCHKVRAFRARHAHRTPHAGRGPTASERRLQFPSEVPPVHAPARGQRLASLPITWLHLPVAPSPTGSTPMVLASVRVPCHYQVKFAFSGNPGPVIPVAVFASHDGVGVPDPTEFACPEARTFLAEFPLPKLRTGSYRVVDALLGGDPMAQSPRAVTVQLVPEDEHLLPIEARASRGCDARATPPCPRTGVCAVAAPGTWEGLCIPPEDPALHDREHCDEGFTSRTLFGPSGALQACVRACTVDDECPARPQMHCVGASASGPGFCAGPG